MDHTTHSEGNGFEAVEALKRQLEEGQVEYRRLLPMELWGGLTVLTDCLTLVLDGLHSLAHFRCRDTQTHTNTHTLHTIIGRIMKEPEEERARERQGDCHKG